MNICQAARNAALRIARKHIDNSPNESLVTDLAISIQEAIDFERAQTSSYFIMQECTEYRGQLFWDGEKWTGPQTRKVYTDFDEATKAYRKAFLACEGKVAIAHVTPGGIVKYQPI